MILLTPAGYEQTRAKLANLEKRLAALEKRTDLNPRHFAEVRRSCQDMMRKYRREIKLFEAAQARQGEASPSEQSPPAQDHE
jgi:hypothetical protein